MPENLESLKNVDVLIAGDPREFRIVQGRKVNDWEEGEMWRILIKDLKSKVEFEVNAEILVKMPEKHDDDINPKYEILIIDIKKSHLNCLYHQYYSIFGVKIFTYIIRNELLF